MFMVTPFVKSLADSYELHWGILWHFWGDLASAKLEAQLQI
jgi:hypothetical protein